jgi:hypothetical protein
MKTNDSPVAVLSSLLKGELSAVETYQQAMASVDADKAAELRQIHHDHIEAANVLRQHIHQHGGQPPQKSGAWGTFAKAVEGAATLLGNRAALRALKTGEQKGIKDYEKAAQARSLPGDCQELIRSTLLPQTRAHVPTLERLIKAR